MILGKLDKLEERMSKHVEEEKKAMLDKVNQRRKNERSITYEIKATKEADRSS